ncbi:MAG: TIGR00153 family protein [Victivallaceae bacterium]
MGKKGILMQTLARLFGRSPFAPLEAHMRTVSECVGMLPKIFSCLKSEDYIGIERTSKDISEKEHEADCLKNDIRNHLSGGLFLPISRTAILEILSLQDSLADRAEDAAILLTFRQLKLLPTFESDFFLFLNKNLEAFDSVIATMKELNELLESSFGGFEASKTREKVFEVAKKEHEADLLQRVLLKTFLSDQSDINQRDLFLWLKVTQAIAAISDNAEKLANRVNMTLEER